MPTTETKPKPVRRDSDPLEDSIEYLQRQGYVIEERTERQRRQQAVLGLLDMVRECLQEKGGADGTS